MFVTLPAILYAFMLIWYYFVATMLTRPLREVGNQISDLATHQYKGIPVFQSLLVGGFFCAWLSNNGENKFFNGLGIPLLFGAIIYTGLFFRKKLYDEGKLHQNVERFIILLILVLYITFLIRTYY